MSCGSCGGPQPTEVCGCGGFTKVGDSVKSTLVSSLTPTVDRIRDIQTRLGAREYTVQLVWTRWTSGERGIGNESIVQVCPILPTPDIGDLNELDIEMLQIGTEEDGTVKISEISPRFNEDVLMGRGVVVRTGDPIPDDMSFYWEIIFARSEVKGQKRRFVPKSAPNKDPTGFEWTIELQRASEDRTREGDPN